MNDLLQSGEKIDDLMRNGYRIIQDPNRFCFGIDAVLLSGFAKVLSGETVLDLGTGTGILPILLEAKTEGSHFTGLEIQEESADMARRSIALNHLENKIDIVTGDIRDASKRFGASSFSVITVNPPYMIHEHGLTNQSDAKTIARHEVLCSLEDVLRESAKILPHHGRFYMVHRPFRLAEILTKMHTAGLEPKRMRFVHPYVDREPTLILVEGLRGGKSGMKIESPLIIHEADGSYTQEMQIRHGF